MLRPLLLIPIVVALQSPTKPATGAAAPPVQDDAGGSVLIWRRASGAADKHPRAAQTRLTLDSLALVERTIRDPRAKAENPTIRVRGTTLQALLAAARKARADLHAPSIDTVVLRFKNGTRLPVPLGDAEQKALDIFIARSVRVGERWSNDFESLPLGPSNYPAPRSLVFSGNRVFVGDPARLVAVAGGFDPTGFLDSLIEIELIDAGAWRKVLEVGDAPVEKGGLSVFLNRCAFCHGVRGAGASLGWDFVQPMPLSTWRKTPEALFDHVRASKLQAGEQGLIMPAQHNVTLEEMKLLHAWMQRVAETQLRPYATPMP